jgi:hypothetical protein
MNFIGWFLNKIKLQINLLGSRSVKPACKATVEDYFIRFRLLKVINVTLLTMLLSCSSTQASDTLKPGHTNRLILGIECFVVKNPFYTGGPGIFAGIKFQFREFEAALGPSLQTETIDADVTLPYGGFLTCSYNKISKSSIIGFSLDHLTNYTRTLREYHDQWWWKPHRKFNATQEFNMVYAAIGPGLIISPTRRIRIKINVLLAYFTYDHSVTIINYENGESERSSSSLGGIDYPIDPEEQFLGKIGISYTFR